MSVSLDNIEVVGHPELFTPPPISGGVLVGDQDSWWISGRFLVDF